MKHYDYLIVGSGLAGSVFAYEATQKGKNCLVIEKRNHIGGNIYDEEIRGILIHRYGPHIFHTGSREIWDYMGQFAQFNHYINSPVANFKGEIYNLPFNMNTFAQMWGIVTPAEAMFRIEQQRGECSGEPGNLEEQALRLVGRDIYEKLIKGYTEKQWGRPCSELPAFIINRLPVRYTYDNNYFNDAYQGIPKQGYTSIIKKMLEGCDVRLSTDYLDNPLYYRAAADKVIYTGMIDRYFGYKKGKLSYRSLRFEDKYYEEDNKQGVAVVNYTDRETPQTRTIEHKHFQFGTQPGTVVTYEYPAEWKPENEPYYPVNNRENQSLYEEYRQMAEEESEVFFLGRLAEYRYYDMDKAVAASLELVGRELSK